MAALWARLLHRCAAACPPGRGLQSASVTVPEESAFIKLYGLVGFLAVAGTALAFAITVGAGFVVALVQRRPRDRPWASLRAFRIARSALPVAVVSALAVAALLVWDLQLGYRTKALLDDAAPAIPVLALVAWAVCHRLTWGRN